MSDDYRQRFYASYVSNFTGGRGEVEGTTGRVNSAPYLDRLADRLMPADRTTRVLDVGCGSGTLLAEFARRGYSNLRGVDAAPEQVKFAHDKGRSYIEGGMALEFLKGMQDDAFDVVVAFDILEHLRKDELLDLIGEVFRVLAPSGRFILHIPNAEAIFPVTILYSDFTHETAFTEKSIRQVLSVTGFRNVSCYEDTPVAHGPVSLVRAVLWQLIRSVSVFVYAVETGSLRRARIVSQNMLVAAIK